MRKVVKHIISPILIFIKDSKALGVILVVCTIISVLIANSFLGEAYRSFWEKPFCFGTSMIILPNNLLEWINSFLMGIFFVLVGTEIKRELLYGELSSFKKAMLPLVAALGGMLIPASIFYLINIHSGLDRGWGIPTATDIAFALGAASLLGSKVPYSLKVFLMALAIIDDLGAVVIISFFYGQQINWIYLSIALFILILLVLVLFLKIEFGILQVFLGFVLWYAIFNSGISASVSGILFAFTVPSKKIVDLEKVIHNLVFFFILPLFIIANTAILLPDNIIGLIETRIAVGVILGLVIGKPLGVFIFGRLMVYLKLADLPSNVNWKQFFGIGLLAGLGFTMSIFITMLAYTDELTRNISKIAIITSLLITVIITIIYFNLIYSGTNSVSKIFDKVAPNELN